MHNSRKRSNIVPDSPDPRAANASKYRPEYCELVIRMAKDGKFPEQWCIEIGVTLSTLYNWANRQEDFDRACQIAWTALTAHWSQLVTDAVFGKIKISEKVMLQILRKRFPDTWGFDAKNNQQTFPTRWVTGIPKQFFEKSKLNLGKMSEDELVVEIINLDKARSQMVWFLEAKRGEKKT